MFEEKNIKSILKRISNAPVDEGFLSVLKKSVGGLHKDSAANCKNPGERPSFIQKVE